MTLAEAIIAAERRGDAAAGIALLNRQGGLTGAEAENLLLHLYGERAWNTAGMLAEILAGHRTGDPVLTLIQTHLAAERGDEAAVARGVAAWGQGGWTAASHPLIPILFDQVLTGRVERLFNTGQGAAALALLPVCALVQPVLAAQFLAAPQPAIATPPHPAPPPFAADLAALPRVARHKRRVLLVLRQHVYAIPGARLFELPPLWAANMRDYGWDVAMVPAFPIRRGLAEATALLDQGGFDAVFCDEIGKTAADTFCTTAEYRAFIERARRTNPGIRIVGLYFDPWQKELWPEIRAIAPFLDGAAAAAPSLALWRTKELRPIFAPLPNHYGLPGWGAQNVGTPRRLTFLGSVSPYNFQRAFWLEQAKRAGLPLDVTVVEHQDDALDPLTSYRAYMDRLAAGGAVLSLSMRRDGFGAATGRCFEALLAGALLVQEECADTAYYFTPGRHCVSFRSFADLAAVTERMLAEPEWAKAIAQAGHDYARAMFVDSILPAYDAWLWGANGQWHWTNPPAESQD